MKARRFIQLLLTVTLAFSLYAVGAQLLDYRAGQAAHAAAIQTAGFRYTETARPTLEILPAEEASDPYAEALAGIDLEALRAINPDVIGWIDIPGTDMTYPLMQCNDNDYYLRHTWDGASGKVGSIYVDYRNYRNLQDYNTVIYGHHMRDGSMFAGLLAYGEADFRAEHPYIYLVTDAGVQRYQVFACYETDTPDTYTVGFLDEAARAGYLADCVARDPNALLPETNRRILTLSTCTTSGYGYDTRWIVQAARA